MLVFDLFSAHFRRRTAHGKSSWRTPDHIHRHSGIKINCVVTRHRDRACGGVCITRTIGHRVCECISSCGVCIHGTCHRDLSS